MQRVVFLMSDTGGGHRAAADAIRAALEQRYPGRYISELVDVYRRYTPFPFKYLPEIYPRWVNYAAPSWQASYWLSNGHRRSRAAMALLNRAWGAGLCRLVREHPADVMVSVHALFSRPVMHALHASRRYRPPFVTVITDLVSTHAFWYEPDVERCLVPTEAAYQRGRRFGLRPEQLRLTGLPVHPRFVTGRLERSAARHKLGWDPVRPAVLLSGGADGMGPVYDIARYIDRHRLPLQLAIVAGRNRRLMQRLRAVGWQQPVHLYPFVSNMHDLIAAADILVTKAGPATITEACVAGVPLILSGAIPGQEVGNVQHVVAHGAGVYAAQPARVAATVAAWLAGDLDGWARRARRLARPDAVWEIADEIHAHAQQAPVRTRQPCSLFRRQPPRLRPAPEDSWVL
jgi:1,2-diacylglycerol 3-beta-galactosyltransferase